MENRNFVNGDFIDSLSKSSIEVLNPSNQIVVGSINEALDDEIDMAMHVAKKLLKKEFYKIWTQNKNQE